MRQLRGGVKDARLLADEGLAPGRAYWLAEVEALQRILAADEADLLETEELLRALGYELA